MRATQLSKCWQGAAVAAAVIAAASPAFGQAAGLALDRFDPAPAGDRMFGVQSPYSAGELTPHVMLLADYAHDPLVIKTTPANSDLGAVVQNQLYLHLNGGLSLWNRLFLNIDVPVALYENGDSPVIPDGSPGGETFASPSGAKFGDLRVGARVALFGEYFDPFQIAVGGYVWFPTGAKYAFVSDGEVRGLPQLILGGRVAGAPGLVRRRGAGDPGVGLVRRHPPGEHVQVGRGRRRAARRQPPRAARGRAQRGPHLRLRAEAHLQPGAALRRPVPLRRRPRGRRRPRPGPHRRHRHARLPRHPHGRLHAGAEARSRSRRHPRRRRRLPRRARRPQRRPPQERLPDPARPRSRRHPRRRRRLPRRARPRQRRPEEERLPAPQGSRRRRHPRRRGRVPRREGRPHRRPQDQRLPAAPAGPRSTTASPTPRTRAPT